MIAFSSCGTSTTPPLREKKPDSFFFANLGGNVPEHGQPAGSTNRQHGVAQRGEGQRRGPASLREDNSLPARRLGLAFHDTSCGRLRGRRGDCRIRSVRLHPDQPTTFSELSCLVLAAILALVVFFALGIFNAGWLIRQDFAASAALLCAERAALLLSALNHAEQRGQPGSERAVYLCKACVLGLRVLALSTD